MPEELRFIEATRHPTARELRWMHLKLNRSRQVLGYRARFPIGCLCFSLAVLGLLLNFHGSGFWTWLMAITGVIAILWLNGNRGERRKIDRMDRRVDSGKVRESRIVSSECFELRIGESAEDGSSLHFFDLGEEGIVLTRLHNRTPDRSFRKFHLFTFPVRDDEEGMAITDLRFSITHRFPNSNFVVASFVVDDRVLARWVRCSGQVLKPVRSIFFGSDDETYEGPGYEAMVVIAKPFDECMLQVLERR